MVAVLHMCFNIDFAIVSRTLNHVHQYSTVLAAVASRTHLQHYNVQKTITLYTPNQKGSVHTLHRTLWTEGTVDV